MGPPPLSRSRRVREGDSGKYRESPGTRASTAPAVPRPSPGSKIATRLLVRHLSGILALCFLLSRESVTARLTLPVHATPSALSDGGCLWLPRRSLQSSRLSL